MVGKVTYVNEMIIAPEADQKVVFGVGHKGKLGSVDVAGGQGGLKRFEIGLLPIVRSEHAIVGVVLQSVDLACRFGRSIADQVPLPLRPLNDDEKSFQLLPRWVSGPRASRSRPT